MMPDAFGANTISQLLKQAGVDVLGLCLEEQPPRVYLIDVAFHAGGLNYGGRENTKKRIFKKMVRSLLLGRHYFPNYRLDAGFASPVVTRSHEEGVNKAFELVRAWIGDDPLMNASLFLNQEFKTEILDETLQLKSDVQDTSELFLRAWQMIAPFMRIPTTNTRTIPSPQEQDLSHPSHPTPSRALIGQEKQATLIAALYLSKFGHARLGLGNQGETIAQLAKSLGINKHTLRNYRDFFDSHVPESTREGWKKPLPHAQKTVFDQYAHLSESALRAHFQ